MYRKDKKNEHYTILARKQGYPARSVYKLKEIDEKFGILKEGDRVLDLGCAPGSWLLYILQKAGDRGMVVGVDTEEIKIPPKANLAFIEKSIFDLEPADFKGKFDAVLSDLAPNTTGIKFLDAAKSLELVEKALEIAIAVLAPNGNFVCKLFENELSNELSKKANNYFRAVKRFKPKATIKRSKEIYFICKWFRP